MPKNNISILFWLYKAKENKNKEIPLPLFKMLSKCPFEIRQKILEGLLMAATKKLKEQKLRKLTQESKLNNDIMDTEWGKIILKPKEDDCENNN